MLLHVFITRSSHSKRRNPVRPPPEQPRPRSHGRPLHRRRPGRLRFDPEAL